MKIFKDGQRVTVIDAEHPMRGLSGTVKRRRIADTGAWVNMDQVPPDDLLNFAADDSRHKHVILYPDQCDQEIASGSRT